MLKEQQNKFDRNVLFAPKDCYLEGFWQSELYFKDFESIIRQDFEFNTFLNSKNQSNLNQIKKCQCPVSVHIRRGDYIHSSHYSKIHITLNSTFYNKATSFMEKKIANPTYFVFSDDIEWAKKNLSFKHPTIFIDNNNNENSFEDMRLMSNCKHHIIANSTFSWWGAWLNSSKEKIVIAPQKWFKIEELEKKDLIPKEWITI
ncbi:MAG: alpha-1,2-fucosyltransferase [bacterium]